MPSLFFTGTWQSKAMPHMIMILDCQVLGLNLFRSKFEGASNTM
jgi:hypothetical protein